MVSHETPGKKKPGPEPGLGVGQRALPAQIAPLLI